ncbi:3-keto-disaccharide hydrolase [Pedobacter punctiformis]|uniref:DUF1080 domain-containing protein n=1 Tax=Pedobacter punctiformis TaxID=3004097 RepID=A0ABT4LCF2_9SPHI|nr:DUF1080 domain-containing protein [Pedobacter sp. HCMS5-2]MCZ4245601.1 DUF1080 domain-containing protein [Pedobacter sp. HCMS5-2]
MKKIFLSACILLAVTQITKAQKGFKPLFDGKTTTGWHTYSKTTVGSAWQVQDGTLHLDPSKKGQDGGGDLVTDKEYSNFHLKLDWKVAPKSNSGIIFFVHEEPKFHATYSTGPEMQVLDNDGHPDGKITKHRSGDLYDLIKSYSEPVKPVGQWNRAEIISKNGKLTLILNGVKTVNTTLWDENWKTLIAGSKFAKWEGFGTYKTGKIALQDHGDEVWFKNILIKEL